jgi:carotenoid 1,2-hydratase
VWWYLDAFSDDGDSGLTVIAFIGSVFSPYYAHARRQGRGDPQDHIALNVALYGKRGARWSMTERGRQGLQQSDDGLAIGPSIMRWQGDTLELEVDEIAVPFPRRIRGTIRLHPEYTPGLRHALDDAEQHFWQPVAPRARVEVRLDHPGLAWNGTGYMDSNLGAVPLEDSFTDWDWSRATGHGGDARLVYQVRQVTGNKRDLALHFRQDGACESFDPPPARRLPRAWWGVSGAGCLDKDQPMTLVARLEDTPFYSRTRLSGVLDGQPVDMMHESLSLQRFRQRWVQALLPFRMPRRT